MPVPQEINFIVEQASCLFLRMVKDVSYACSTRDKFYCGTGILPVLKNSARYELQPSESLKNPVSLILVHHPKSDFNTPFIIESASTHILCVDAVSTAKPDKGDW
ncbi:hypothetical protein QUB75_08485 [Microcoleus sp. K1-B6]|uniref:hypothetical protein n=1 Tax=unclassified Microcoleus TaxID=2642155 RepID=UPI002FD06FAF